MGLMVLIAVSVRGALAYPSRLSAPVTLTLTPTLSTLSRRGFFAQLPSFRRKPESRRVGCAVPKRNASSKPLLSPWIIKGRVAHRTRRAERGNVLPSFTVLRWFREGGNQGSGSRRMLSVEMTLEMVIIAAARVAGSLHVLRWAVFGAILAILGDFSDLFMMNLLDLGGVRNYQAFDKWVDQVYMLTFLWVAARQWDGPGRTVAIWLFGMRLIGFVTFEVMSAGSGDARWILMVFPNVFEFWFVAIAAQQHWWPGYEWTRWRILAWLAVCTVLKLFQEYTLHVWQVLDNYVAVDVVAVWWEFLTGLF